MASFSTLLVLAFGGHLLPSGWSTRRHPFGQSSPRWCATCLIHLAGRFCRLPALCFQEGRSLAHLVFRGVKTWLAAEAENLIRIIWSRGFTSKGPLPSARASLASSSHGHGESRPGAALGPCWLQGFLCRGGCQWLDAIHLRRLHLWASGGFQVRLLAACEARLFSNQYDCFR